MMQNPPFDQSIPVLTEVIEGALDRTPTPAPAPAPDPAPAAITTAPTTTPLTNGELGAQLEAQAVSGWNENDWSILERRLSERILHQLQERVDFVLEQRVKDCMAEVLQRALSELTGELRCGLEQTMEKIVARAVLQELTHLQARKE